MRCPNCGHEGLRLPAPCPNCRFSGNPAWVEELAHIAYLLAELEGWTDLSPQMAERLRTHYTQRRNELEVKLGLRLPPLTPAVARQAWWEIACLEELLAELREWVSNGWARPDAAQALADESLRRIRALRTRLADGPPSPDFEGLTDELALLRFLHQSLDDLHAQGGLVSESARAAAAADLGTDIEAIEIELGLRPPRPEPVEEPEPAPPPPIEEPQPEIVEELTPEPLGQARDVPAEGLRPELAEGPPPRKPREPITWDRIWQTLLSERTLRAILFVGVFLLFASAVTFIAFNWQRFPDIVKLLFLVAFTLTFYALGWYVRVKMRLWNSGIALTATGSLLVPLDFYAVYLGGGFAPYATAEQVWLLTSVVCLAAYLATVWVIEAEFFGYLVAGAAGSLLCAALRVMGVSPDWYAAALSALSLLAVLLAERLRPERVEGRWHVLQRPLWHAALLCVTAVMPLALGWRVLRWPGSFILGLSLAAAWWFGCLVYAFGALRLRLRVLWVAAVVGLPATVFLTQWPIFDRAEIRPAWHAPGWALLALLYQIASYRLRTHSRADDLIRGYGRAVAEWGVLIGLLAALWSFSNPTTAPDAATATHAVLTLTAALAARLWERPRWLFAASFFSLVSITAAMAARELTLAQLGLGWALLAVLHLALAVRLKEQPTFAVPAYAAGFALAALTLLPPLLGDDGGLLVYALGNWIGLAAWTAWLRHTDQHPGLEAFLRPFGRWGATLPHWAAALPLPVWLWLTWTHPWRRSSLDRAWLGVALGLLAWGLVVLGRRLARQRAAYGLPWYVTGDLTSLLAPVAGLIYFAGDRALLALVFLLISALYFASAWLFRQRWWLEPAGVTLPIAWLLFLAHHHVLPAPTSALLTLLPAAYLLGGLLLGHFRNVEGRFFQPLNVVAHALSALAVLWGLVPLWERLIGRSDEWADPDRLWAAGGQLLLGVVYGLVAWGFRRERWAHLAAWLGVSAGGIVATVYSQGRGSSAFKAALLAAVYVLAERSLLALRDRWTLAPRAWQLYRRPLLIAGWAVSAGAIFLALFRNLVLLGGGRVREIWAVAGLLTVAALYALSARLFRRPLFVWLAATLAFAPWTILTHLGWFVVPWAPRPTEYALAWLALAWLQLGLGLWLESRGARPFGFPLRVVAHLLVPFSLLWCVADPLVASTGWGMGVAFYTVSAVVDRRRMPDRAIAARFLYPAAGLTPVWAVYLLARFAPAAEHIHFGLLLLAFGPLGLLAGILLHRVHPADALPMHLTAYGSALVGTLLVAHERPWLIAALMFDAALCAFSAWLHAEPLWGYPTAALPVVAMTLALTEFGVDPNRHGWALIGLGAFYLVAAHWLRAFRRGRYAGPVIAVAYVAVALGLPPSSRDQIGAFWGYGGAALVYALSAIWLQQPLFLTPAVALAAVPYAVGLVRSPAVPANYGLWLWPGILVSLGLAHLLDFYLGAPRDFPWDEPSHWLAAAGERLLTWPGLPFYAGGYIAAAVAGGLAVALGDASQIAITFMLAAAAYALATLRFRLSFWLLAAHGTALIGMALVAPDRPWLIAMLLFEAGLCIFFAWLYAEPLWGYPAAAFPVVALMLILDELGVNPDRHGWGLIVLGAAYLILVHGLRTLGRRRYAGPIMVVAYVAVTLGLLPSSGDQIGAFWGYGGAVLVYALSAVWLQQPVFLTPAVALAWVPYGVSLAHSVVALENYGLWLWPGIVVSLGLAYLLDSRLGAPRDFPWGEPWRWPAVALERWLAWWGLPLHASGFLTAAVAVELSDALGDAARVAATLALAAAACALATLYFRLRAWLLIAAATAQLAALALIHQHVHLWRPAHSALAFLPVTAATALIGLFIEQQRGEGSPFDGWRSLVSGWSRPLYALLAVDLLLGQLASLADAGPGSLVTLGHTLLVALLASVWRLPLAAYAAAGLGLIALFQRLYWYAAPATHYPMALAVLALGYALWGYGLRYVRRQGQPVPVWVRLWETPFVHTGMALTALALLWTPFLGAGDVVWLTIQALFEQPILFAAQVPSVQMAITVLAVAGLTYLAAALVERRLWLGYGAVAMLLIAYGLELLLFLGQREVQWYAVPAGIYLLGVGYLEWREGRQSLARWTDRTAMLLLFGSSFWQSLALDHGWRYALVMGAEGLAVGWWGSARRQRRFLYSGVSAVVIAVVGQLIEPLFSVNAFIVLGGVGLAVVLLGLFVERRLEMVRQLSRELLERLEDWE